MWKAILEWLRKVVDKRICTVEEFEKASAYALTEVAKDQDGFLSVKEVVKLIIKTIRITRS